MYFFDYNEKYNEFIDLKLINIKRSIKSINC